MPITFIRGKGDVVKAESNSELLQLLKDALNNYDFVIESQTPTVQNNYTWYRKYKSGWIEQGGHSFSVNVNLPITMANTDYMWSINTLYNDAYTAPYFELGALTSKTTTGFTKAGNAQEFIWSVCGVCA